MKITIEIPTAARRSRKLTLMDIANKANEITDQKDFFLSTPDGDTVYAGECANTECHNKLIILISMWIDSNNNKLSGQYCFTSFGRLGPYNQKYPVAWVLGSNVPEDKQKFIRAWMDFLDSIGNEENLKKIDFNFNVKN